MTANKIRKAVFPVAGIGSRFLPATKAMPKELLPIINKPLIQYAVEEAVMAGIDTMIFVTGRNKRAIEDHFDRNSELETILRAQGKIEEEKMVANILPKGVECIFVRQPEQLGLGHAILCAERVVGSEAFAVILADDFVNIKESGPISELVNSYSNSNKTQLSMIKVRDNEVSKYGILKFDENNKVIGLIEKPDLKDAPSNFASIGRYVLTSDIFDRLRSLKKGKNKEIQLADAINEQAREGNVEAYIMKGERFDCGSVEGFVEATICMAGINNG